MPSRCGILPYLELRESVIAEADCESSEPASNAELLENDSGCEQRRKTDVIR